MISTLYKKNTFLRYNKFNTHRYEEIGWIKYTSPTIALNRSTKVKIDNELFFIYLIDEKIT